MLTANYSTVDSLVLEGSYFSLSNVTGAKYVIQEKKERSSKHGWYDRLISFLLLDRFEKKFNNMNAIFTTALRNAKTLEQREKCYSFAKLALDAFYDSEIDKIDELSNPPKSTKNLINAMNSFIQTLKDGELELRLKLYPDKNEVVLNYDELRELQIITRDWEPAEEQSSVYQKT